METPQKFRTAFNGFHREDVVQYLEFLNTKHQTQVNQLTLEIENLRTQLETQSHAQPVPDSQLSAECDALKTELEACAAKHTASEQQLEECRTQLDETRAALAEAEAQCRQLQEQCSQLEAQRDSLQDHCDSLEAQCEGLNHRFEALNQQSETPDPLDTYRHAEDLVRKSRTRAELVYYQTNGVLTEASAKVEAAAKDITALADHAMAELTRLQMAVSTSKHTLQDAAAMMKSIRPNE